MRTCVELLGILRDNINPYLSHGLCRLIHDLYLKSIIDRREARKLEYIIGKYRHLSDYPINGQYYFTKGVKLPRINFCNKIIDAFLSDNL